MGHQTKLGPNPILLHLQQLAVVCSTEKNLSISVSSHLCYSQGAHEVGCQMLSQNLKWMYQLVLLVIFRNFLGLWKIKWLPVMLFVLTITLFLRSGIFGIFSDAHLKIFRFFRNTSKSNSTRLMFGTWRPCSDFPQNIKLEFFLRLKWYCKTSVMLSNQTSGCADEFKTNCLLFAGLFHAN